MSTQTVCAKVVKCHLLHLNDFLMTPQIASLRRDIATLVELFYFSPLCVFKCLLKLLAREDEKLHWLHLFGLSPLCVFKCFFKSLA